MYAPLDSHRSLVKRIFWYLSGTINNDTLLSPANLLTYISIRSYSDSDWASDSGDMRSTRCTCIYLGLNLEEWSSKKLSLVARSSTKVEYRALAHITSKLLWIESLLAKLHPDYHTPTLPCENLSVVLLSNDIVLHARTKHIELDIYFVRKYIVVGKLKIQHVLGHMQIVDALTKPFPTALFIIFHTKLKVHDLHSLWVWRGIRIYTRLGSYS